MSFISEIYTGTYRVQIRREKLKRSTFETFDILTLFYFWFNIVSFNFNSFREGSRKYNLIAVFKNIKSRKISCIKGTLHTVTAKWTHQFSYLFVKLFQITSAVTKIFHFFYTKPMFFIRWCESVWIYIKTKFDAHFQTIFKGKPIISIS